MALFYDGRAASDSNGDSDAEADADADVGPSLQQFWEDLTSAVCMPCATYEEIDDALRAWLDLVSSSRDQILLDEIDLARCSQCLLNSPIGAAHIEYVHTQIIYSLLQEDDARPLHAIANFLLLTGRAHEAVFQQMVEAGCFARLVDLIKGRRDDDRRLHRLLLELMYEMSRIEHIRLTDLLHVDDAFVCFLLQIIENLSDDATDPYHYPVIRVLLVLNEQYMVAATTAAVDSLAPVLTNRVIKVLSLDGPLYRTFGENLILLLNRETETSLQLLILKLLYLLFTTKATYEYFYTNDLRVLVDVIVRNLLDLPNESISLRHTYLRVLFPLLAHTQLNQPPQYKRDEILRVLAVLGGSGNAQHFAPADETTMRLVDRVSQVEWLAVTPPAPSSPASPSPRTSMDETAATRSTAPEAAKETNGEAATDAEAGANTPHAATTPVTTTASAPATTTTAATSRASHTSTASSSSMSSGCSSGVAERDEDGHHAVVNKFLGISLSREGRDSQASVADMAHVREKPGVQTPSRKAECARGEPQLAPPPGRRRSHSLRTHNGRGDSSETDSGDSSSSSSDSSSDDDSNSNPAPPRGVEGEAATPQRRTPDAHAPSVPSTRSTTASPVATRPPPPPPDRRPHAARRALPTVPKHRHGAVLAKPPPPPPTVDEAATAVAAAAAAAALASSGVGGGGGGGDSSSGSPSMPSSSSGGASAGGASGTDGATTATATATAAAAAAAALSGPHGPGHATHATHAAHAAHAAHATHHSGGIVKKLPPKAPPPRRAGRLKQAASNANLHAALESRTE